MKFDAVLFNENSFVGVFLFRKNEQVKANANPGDTQSEETLRSNVLSLFEGGITMHMLRDAYDPDRNLIYEGMKGNCNN